MGAPDIVALEQALSPRIGEFPESLIKDVPADRSRPRWIEVP
jgi:hypothetical protein